MVGSLLRNVLRTSRPLSVTINHLFILVFGHNYTLSITSHVDMQRVLLLAPTCYDKISRKQREKRTLAKSSWFYSHCKWDNAKFFSSAFLLCIYSRVFVDAIVKYWLSDSSKRILHSSRKMYMYDFIHMSKKKLSRLQQWKPSITILTMVYKACIPHKCTGV